MYLSIFIYGFMDIYMRVRGVTFIFACSSFCLVSQSCILCALVFPRAVRVFSSFTAHSDSRSFSFLPLLPGSLADRPCVHLTDVFAPFCSLAPLV